MDNHKLVVALGNPGREYEFTRHNIGWILLDVFPECVSLSWEKKFKGLYTYKMINSEKIFFLKPQTYMNLSGESVRSLMVFFKLKLENLLVIHDDMDFPFGTLAFKSGGGLAGHNGLKSIARELGSQEFKRLRLGVGRPVNQSDSNWVLSPFSSHEEVYLNDYMKLASEALHVHLYQGFQKAASGFSKKTCIVKTEEE